MTMAETLRAAMILALLSLPLPAQTAGNDGPRAWRKIEPGHALEFPRDHGAHPEYRTEWWYVTGNLADADGRRFGVQLTFFRTGLGDAPPADARRADAAGRAWQVWAGHIALVDVRRGETHLAERLRRGSSPLVSASLERLDFQLEDWALVQGDDGVLDLRAADPATGIAMDLRLEPAKPLVLHGEDGVSTKGFEPGNASAYATWTRLETTGTLAVGGQAHAVSGDAWLDHEWGSGQLGAGVVGWDWFGLHLDDGRELMVYGLRREDGTPHPVSGGTLIEVDGTARALKLEDFEIEQTARWTSPHTQASYPAGWIIRVPSASLSLRARPLVADCELDTGSTNVVYWEGPVELSDPVTSKVLGRGYAELVGYAHGMEGRF